MLSCLAGRGPSDNSRIAAGGLDPKLATLLSGGRAVGQVVLLLSESLSGGSPALLLVAAEDVRMGALAEGGSAVERDVATGRRHQGVVGVAKGAASLRRGERGEEGPRQEGGRGGLELNLHGVCVCLRQGSS